MPEELPAAAERTEIVDPNNVPTVFVDWIITGGQIEGVINVALGTIDHSLNRAQNLDELSSLPA